MHEHLLPDIGKAILAAAILGLPAYLCRIPLLLAYLVAGVVLGSHLGLGLIDSEQSISTISEIGLVLLMFILGLEIDLRKLLKTGKAVLVNGVTQFAGCALLGVLFFGYFGFGKSAGPYGLVYLAFTCAISSTLIVVKILSERMILDTFASRVTLGILVMQDLWAIGFLSIQPNIADMSFVAVAMSAGKAVLLVFVSWLFARFILPTLFTRAAKQPELMLIMAMAWCFSVCGLAHALHLSVEMGALVAGVSIASFPYHLDVVAKVTSLRDFFITLFFVSLGLQIPMPNKEVLILAAAIVFFVSFSRILTIFPVLHWMKYGNRASLLPALNLSQLSEFSLVLAALGVSYGHVNKDLLSAFTLAMVATALMSSAVIPSGHRIYRLINRFLEKIGFADHVSEGDIEESDGADHPQIVLLGLFREASSLLAEMSARYSDSALKKLLVVDFNPEAHHQMQKMGIPCRYGDVSHIDTLRHLHLEKSNLLICTLPDVSLKGITNLKLLKILRGLAPKAKIIVTAETLRSAREMYESGADYVLIPRLVTAHFLADILERFQSESGEAIRAGAMEFLEKRREILP